MTAITSTTLRRLQSLTPDDYTEVIKLVTRHTAACRRAGFVPESLERVVLEAMEIVAKGWQSEYGDGPDEGWKLLSGEVRSYGQYKSPVDSRMG